MLDLGGAESHEALWDGHGVTDVTILGRRSEADLASKAHEGERFDTIFSVFRLVASDDAARTLSHVHRLLADDGRLLFLEPGRSGSTRRAQRFVAPGVAVATGMRVDRDVLSMLRAAGLSITDLERHRSSTVQWWLRTLVEGGAHHALEPGRPRNS